MILIINSAGVRGIYSRVIDRQSRYLPYASSVIVARLRKNGFPVIHKDLRNSITPILSRQLCFNDFEKWLNSDIKTPSMKEYLARSFDVFPDLAIVRMVGFSIFTHNNYFYALSLAKEIKKLDADIPICFGGCYITIKNLDIPQYVDFYIKGNGGEPICHLANHFINGKPLDKNIPGLSYIENRKTINNDKNQEPAELEELPDFSDLDLNRYLRNIPKEVLRSNLDSNDKFLIVPYRTSLGCYGNCTFCTGRLIDRLRFKSVKKVVEEIKALNSLHQNVLIRFCDSSINNNPKIISKVLDNLIEDNFKFHWNAYVNVNNMSFELLEKFAKTGCNLLAWGVESASPHMINVYNKRFDPLDAQNYIEKAAALGIKNVIFIMFNGPGENTEDLVTTEKFVRRFLKNKNVFFKFFTFALEEGSEIHINPKKYGIEINGRPEKNNYTKRELIKWKQIGLSTEDFEKKQERHSRRRKILQFYQRSVKYFQKNGVSIPELLIFLICKTYFRLLDLMGQINKT